MNLNNLDLNKLVVFSTVVEAGNYRLASEILNVSPSALSQTISSLENSLGVPLFHRQGKKLVLTELGAKIQREFKASHQQLVQAFARLSSDARQISGLVRIGSYLEFAKFQLAPVLADFSREYPEVQIKLVFDTPTRLHSLLEENKIDFCFSIFPERESKLIESKPIFREELLLISPTHLLDKKPTYEEVLAAPIVEYYFNHQPLRRWLSLHFNKRPKKIPVRMFASSAEMVLAFIEQRSGVGIVPEYLLPEGNPNFTVCRPTARKLLDSIWMLQMKNQNHDPALKLLSEKLSSHKFSSSRRALRT